MDWRKICSGPVHTCIFDRDVECITSYNSCYWNISTTLASFVCPQQRFLVNQINLDFRSTFHWQLNVGDLRAATCHKSMSYGLGQFIGSLLISTQFVFSNIWYQNYFFWNLCNWRDYPILGLTLPRTSGNTAQGNYNKGGKNKVFKQYCIFK